MLEALLRGKLAATVPEPQRLEDALTSTIFGTLLMVNATGVLEAWLARSGGETGPGGTPPGDAGAAEAWFWPGLLRVEPDIVLRLGRRLYVIEAKYRSGRHDAVPAEEDETGEDLPPWDQLHRQHAAIDAIRRGTGRGPDGVLKAVTECSVRLIFLVDRRRIHVARREYAESLRRLPPGADLQLLTWQDLYRVLRDQVHPGPGHRWATDLLRYLEVLGLDAFCGVARIGRTVSARSQSVAGWRGAGTPVSRLRDAIGGMRQCGVIAVTRLRTWRGVLAPNGSLGFRESLRLLSRMRPDQLRSRIMAFHGPDLDTQGRAHG
jgi:hypothetical protein